MSEAGESPPHTSPKELGGDVKRVLESNNMENTAKESPIVLGVVVVDFNHLVGPQIEYSYPSELKENAELGSVLPFLALPDGSHMSGEDYCYFHLLCKSLHPSTIFGISCNRQIMSNELINKGSDVTRSMVQKAVVILASKPIFGPTRTKLGMVTHAFFAQRDLQNITLIKDFYNTLEDGLEHSPEHDTISPQVDGHNTLYMGTSIREFIFKWRFKVLVLLKLLLLQRKIMFFGYPVEQLCTSQYNLVSLIPALLSNLEDSASPELDSHSRGRSKAESLRMSDRQSVLAFMGLPLPLFGEGAFFQPYCPLQQMDLLHSQSWLIGTTNLMFKQQRMYKPDVIVDLETMQLQFLDPNVGSLVSLTPADRKWMDGLVNIIQETWNSADPAHPAMMQYAGSDDYLRARFEEYVFGVLSSAKFLETHATTDDASPTTAFGSDFLSAFRQTSVFGTWNSYTDDTLCDLIPYQHPFTGKTSTVSYVALRLQAGLHDLRLEENLGPTREAIGAALQAGSASLSKVASNWRQDITRFAASNGWQTPLSVWSEKDTTSPSNANPEVTDKREDAASSSSTPTKRTEPILSSLQATGMQGAAALSTFGSFLSAKQKSWYNALNKQTDTEPKPP